MLVVCLIMKTFSVNSYSISFFIGSSFILAKTNSSNYAKIIIATKFEIIEIGSPENIVRNTLASSIIKFVMNWRIATPNAFLGKTNSYG